MLRLYRKEQDGYLGGVCSGASEMFKVDPSIIRLSLAAGTLITGFFPLIVLYILAWAIVPDKNDVKDKFTKD